MGDFQGQQVNLPEGNIGVSIASDIQGRLQPETQSSTMIDFN